MGVIDTNSEQVKLLKERLWVLLLHYFHSPRAIEINRENITRLYLRDKNQEDALFYSVFISILSPYMFRAGLLLTTMRYFSVYRAIVMCRADNNGIV
jgi:hypothetical protein